MHIRVPAYDMPTVRYEVIRPRHIYKSIVYVPAVSKKEGVDWMVEGAVDGIESTMSSIAFNRAALSAGLWEVLSSSPPQMRKSFQARTYIQLSPQGPRSRGARGAAAPPLFWPIILFICTSTRACRRAAAPSILYVDFVLLLLCNA